MNQGTRTTVGMICLTIVIVSAVMALTRNGFNRLALVDMGLNPVVWVCALASARLLQRRKESQSEAAKAEPSK